VTVEGEQVIYFSIKHISMVSRLRNPKPLFKSTMQAGPSALIDICWCVCVGPFLD